MVCGLPPRDFNFTGGFHVERKFDNFSPSVCSPTGEAGKNVQTGFAVDPRLICGMPPLSMVGIKDKFLFRK
jgi:hypothetical protein